MSEPRRPHSSHSARSRRSISEQIPRPSDSTIPSSTSPPLQLVTSRPSRASAGAPDQSPSPASATSAASFSQVNRSATDRVFPIRSVVSVDPSSASSTQRGAGESRHGLNRSESARSVPRWYHSRQTSIGSAQSTEPTNDAAAASTSARRSRPGNPADRSARDSTTRKTSLESARVEPSARKASLESARSSVASDGPEADQGRSRRLPDGDTTSTAGTSSVGGSELGGRMGGSPAASLHGSVGNESSSTSGMVTARFKHVMTDEGHAVITGHDGETLQRCEDEPIHTPGAVQGFGLLMALREGPEGKFAVRVVSENCAQIIGYTPHTLFKVESFCDLLSEEQADNFLDHVDFIRDDDSDVAANGPEVFLLSIRPPRRRTIKLWCAIHVNEANPDLIICEFELEDDQFHPLVPPGTQTPEPPEDTLGAHPTTEELRESTANESKPLRILKRARKRKGEAAAMEVFNIMSQVQTQLADAPTLEKFLKILVGVVKELTGFHRVMIYQFDNSWNGRVVTELVDPRATNDLYKGLNFPASDIPKQARDLYKLNKVRLLYDRDQETARLVCRTTEDLETPLDLTYAYLRAMSPIHIKYLTNMAVRASMSISINAFNELWGLIACHAYGSKGMRVSFPIRKMCRLVGESASRNIERLSYASRLQVRKLINTDPSEKQPSGYIVASSDDLLSLFDADFGLLSIKDETKILGKLEQSQEALLMLEYLRMRKVTSVLASQDLRQDFPDLQYSPGFQAIAGLLMVPLSTNGDDFIIFFRKSQVKEVRWAGNPYEKAIREGTEQFLEPRRSFRSWTETVTSRCRDWTEEQIETAAVLCLVYGKFINVWRQKEVALQSSQMTRLLLANSAHEVRTPLNAIINYLEIALEGSLDAETRENLAKSHSASKSLIYVINDLLDLTKTEAGHDLIKDDVFDLPATIREATENFRGDAARKHISFEVVESPGFPQLVMGDPLRVRQAVSNMMANAIKNTTSGGVKVEMWPISVRHSHVEVEIVIQDTGVGMSAQKLDALFRDLEQVQAETDDAAEQTDGGGSGQDMGRSEGKQTLGLGLAVVARTIRNMNGQLRLKSEEGQGSRFVIQLPFELPPQDGPAPSTSPARASIAPSTHSRTEGEVMLVSRAAEPGQTRSASRSKLGRKASFESMGTQRSDRSMRSADSRRSSKSDVDRLIGAISQPHMAPKGHAANERLAAPFNERSSSVQSRGSGAGSRPMTGAGENVEGHSLTSPRAQDSKNIPGQEAIQDSWRPLKAVRMPEESSAVASASSPRAIGSEAADNNRSSTGGSKRVESKAVHRFNILVAEDDPVNSRIIKKRLEKAGHDVHLTINGEECANQYVEKTGSFDVVLMDMQMPIVDGLSSAKMIRSHERSHPSTLSSHDRRTSQKRIPIFAVSASLLERNVEQYREAGFDGWILKPIDFKRFGTLLGGIVEADVREQALYQPGNWERGGWLTNRRSDIPAFKTSSSSASADSRVERSILSGSSEDTVIGGGSTGKTTPPATQE